MSQLISQVTTFLNQDGMPVEYDGEQPSLQLGLDVDGAQYPVIIRAMDEAGALAIYAYAPTTIPDERLGEVALFVATVNQGLFVGNLEIDTNQALVRCRTSLMLEGTPLTHALFKEAFSVSLTTMHNLAGPLNSVIEGSPGIETMSQFWNVGG